MEVDNYKWSDELLIGNDHIDSDHMAFFDIANIIADLSRAAEIDLNAVDDAVRLLKNYAHGHFQREESFMKQLGYHSWISEHIAKHNQFKAMIDMYTFDLNKKTSSDIRFLSKIVADWLTLHIKSDDQKLKDFACCTGIDTRQLSEFK
jgi:hemerythrin